MAQWFVDWIVLSPFPLILLLAQLGFFLFVYSLIIISLQAASDNPAFFSLSPSQFTSPPLFWFLSLLGKYQRGVREPPGLPSALSVSHL